MKTKGELNALKEEVETVSREPQALSDDELEQVTGGGKIWVSKCKFTGVRSCVGHHDECGACYGLM